MDLSFGRAEYDRRQISLARLPPTRRQTRLTLVGGAVLLFGLAVALPTAARPLPRMNGFIPAFDAIISVTDLITAGLLLAQFSIARSRAIWALACGYLFSAAIVVAHALTFPGAFSPTGDFGVASHINFRVYLLWHLGLPVAIFAYVWLRDRGFTKARAHTRTEIVATVAGTGVVALLSCIAWLDFLPPVDPVAGRWLTVVMILICFAALSALWFTRRSVLDQWLMVVILAMIIELAITGLVGGRVHTDDLLPIDRTRIATLGFYTGRLFSLVTSTVILIALLAETSRLYAGVARANTLASVVQASQTLSSEVAMPKLIEQLMTIALQNAGADRGLLILPRDGDLLIEAEAVTQPGGVQAVARRVTVTPSDLPLSALNDAIRTQEKVLLGDASADRGYAKDEYVRRKHSRSILCLPMMKQAKLVGALYLENNLTAGAFTPDRVTVLQLLASQAAISIENAGLYSDLQREGQNFRRIVDTVPGFLCTMTPRGQVEFVNRGILDYTGWTLEKLADWRPLLHPDEREMVMARWTRSVETGDPYDIEHRIRGIDGSYRWFMVRGLPVRDAQGCIVRWYVLVTDIDERRKTHEELQRSEAFLAQGQRISQTGSFGWSIARGERYWSEGNYSILEYDRALKPSYDLVFDRIHPDDRDFVRQILDEATREKKDFDIEHRLLMPDGRIKHIHLVARAMKTGNLDFIGSITDITAAKKAEEKIRQSESEIRQILDFAPQHVYVLGSDPGATRLYANQAALDYFGLTFEEWRAHDLPMLFHPDDRERALGGTQSQIADGVLHEVEVRLRRKDGKYRWFLSRRKPLRDEHGCLTRWYTTATDIEDHKAAERKLQEENIALREEIDKASMFEEIVGTSATLKKVLSRISRVAPTDSSVLITGETGTGKELVARAVHRRSERSSHPFVSVNCAVIPRDLIASELFGHEKGAFTGATQRRLGRFELAEKGTIFLDEVGELPAETQIALLRVLQEHEFERIGGTGPIRTNVRVVAATNRDLEAAIAAGTFRSDLYYRLNVFPIEVPTLRERREDIPLLVAYFLNRYARKAGRHFAAVDKKSLDLLQSYAWPGNIRELQNVIERSVVVSESQTFSVDESWLSRTPSSPVPEVPPNLFNRPPAQEKAVIEAALRECGGRVYGPSGAAAKLGIPRTTLESKIRSLRINKNHFKG
jgi:formate hydrogenlyase transcriptional activator